MKRAFIAFVFGVVLAGIAVYLVSSRLSQHQESADANVQMAVTPVVVAQRRLVYGDTLRADFLKVIDWPSQSVPEGSFATTSAVVGDAGNQRTVLQSIEKGEPVLSGKITGFGERATVSSRLSEGMRAFSIRINDVSGVAGLLLPGDHVDIMLTRKREDQLVTDVILQNITVLGIDQTVDQSSDKPNVGRTATLEVLPEQAQKLALAQQVGTLSLSMRQVGSTEIVQPGHVDIYDLANETKEGMDTSSRTVRVRRGGEVTVEPLKR